MKLDSDQIKKKLLDVSYKERINSKRIYPLEDVLKEFGFKDLKEYIKTVCDVKTKLDEISYPTKQMFRLYISKNKIVKIDVNAVGLMFVMAEIAKISKNDEEKENAYKIAKVFSENAKMFYPEQRVVLRREYVYVTKQLRGMIKEISENNANLKSSLKKLYSTILNDYYFINDTYYLRLKKTNNPKGNYLDYITVSELNDLIEIQKEVIISLTKYPTDNHLYLANRLASEKRLAFCTHHAGVFPFEYKPHKFKPLRAYKEFYKLLAYYNLDPKSLRKDDDNLEKMH